MNQKEIRELRGRFRPDRANIRAVVGAFVNGNGAIVSKFRQSVSMLDEDTASSVLSLLKKTLSGTPGRNLVDIAFSTAQVEKSDEHRLLSELYRSGLANEDAVNEYLAKVTSSYHPEGNYLILLAADTYDVFAYRKDGSREEDSTEVFSYIVSCVCPVKDAPGALGIRVTEGESTLSRVAAGSLVGTPAFGFTFPAFDDRKTNLYNALFYTKDTADDHAPFIEAVFRTKVPMPADTQKATFTSVLCDAADGALPLSAVNALNVAVRDATEAHRESGDPEPLLLSKGQLSDILASAGVDSEKVEAFGERFDEAFGKNAELPPVNVVESKKFRVTTPDVDVRVAPDHADLVSTRVIGGEKYLLIRAEGEVLVNGIPVSFGKTDGGEE